MKQTPFKAGQPISVGRLNKMFTTGELSKFVPADTDAQVSTFGTAAPFTDPNRIISVRVNGTQSGGYKFTEVYDPNGTGNYVNKPSGVTTDATGFILESEQTLSVGSLVFARINPYFNQTFEAVGNISAGGTVTVSNLDGSQSYSAGTMRFNSGTGIRVIALSSSLGQIVLDYASPIQIGVVTLLEQMFAGTKWVATPGYIGVEPAIGSSEFIKMGNISTGIYGLNCSNTTYIYMNSSTPNVTVVGDLEINNVGQGVILKSPDGNRWRLTVNNSGGVSATGPL